MTFKACKYCQVTQIQWDTEDSLFREADGRAHDRTRCESIRKRNGSSSSSSSNNNPSSQPNAALSTSSTTESKTTYDIANTLIKIQTQLELLPTITAQLNRLSEYYGDIVEHLKVLSSVINKEQKMADAEARYDQDKEDGLV